MLKGYLDKGQSFFKSVNYFKHVSQNIWEQESRQGFFRTFKQIGHEKSDITSELKKISVG